MAGTAKTAAELNTEVDSLVASSQVPPIAALAMRQVLQDMIASSVGMTSSGVVASPNTVMAGPASGTASDAPTFRGLVAADLPGGSGPLLLSSYTVGTLPSASTFVRGLIYVADGAGNQRLAISDGTNWRFPSGSVVS